MLQRFAVWYGRTVRAEQVTDVVTHHGEGPVWDDTVSTLRWVDLLAGDVVSMAPTGEITRLHVGAVAACVVPRRNGGILVATERGFARYDHDLADGEVLPDVWADPDVRMNDGACDPQGRFFIGSMAYDERTGGGRLHRLDPDGTVEVVLDGVTISNGIGWMPDGATGVYIDTPTQCVDRFDFDADAGLFVDRRPFVWVDDGDGWPDGLTVDAEGGVWVAFWDGGVVRRFGPDGTLDLVVELPVARPTSCCFGGADLDELYISTSAVDQPAGDPHAGALFRVVPGVTGLAPARFAG